MFNKNSVFFTLTISFIISILLVLFSFYAIIQKEHATEHQNLKKKYTTISKVINQEYARYGISIELRDMLLDMGLLLIEDENEILNIFKNHDLKLLIKKRVNNILVHIFTNDKKNYLHIQTPYDEFLIVDNLIQKGQHRLTTIFIFLLLLFTIMFIFYKIYKKLHPLNELTSKINHIGTNNIQFDFLKNNNNDEVSLLAKALLEKSQEINNLKEARNIFIRNMMHELKTPITKGRFLVELPNTTEQKIKLKDVFFQLESLISEFASIEEIIAKKQNLQKKEIYFNDMLENALDILMIEDENCIDADNKEIKIDANFKLFSIVIKNLIDNGLKYSKSKKVKITLQQNCISFINDGEKLKYPLEKYFEPFFNNQNKQTDSFGLGLYIVNSILNAHGFKLAYKFEEDNNIFTILLSS